MQTVLLAAGDGESIEPLSSTTPKPLLPVGGEPILVHAARRAVTAGATELVVVVPPYYQPFTRALGDTVDGVPVEYAIQPRPMGTANALVVARSYLDDDFVVLPGDTLFDPEDLSSLYANVPCVGVSARDENTEGAVVVGDGGPLDVTTLGDDRTGPYVDASACSLPAETKHWTRLPPNDDGERDIVGIVERTADGHDLRPVLLGDHVDVDHAWDLLDANQLVLDEWAASVGDESIVEGDVDEQARLHGPVRVEADAVVSPGAVVEGPSVVAAGATIEPNAYVRPYTYVGPNVTIGHSVEVKNSIVLEDASVGSLSSVADSVVGRNASIGAGTKVATLRHDGESVVPCDDVSLSTDRKRFGVVLGEGAQTGVDTTLEAGVVLSRYATVEPGEIVRVERTERA